MLAIDVVYHVSTTQFIAFWQ